MKHTQLLSVNRADAIRLYFNLLWVLNGTNTNMQPSHLSFESG